MTACSNSQAKLRACDSERPAAGHRVRRHVRRSRATPAPAAKRPARAPQAAGMAAAQTKRQPSHGQQCAAGPPAPWTRRPPSACPCTVRSGPPHLTRTPAGAGRPSAAPRPRRPASSPVARPSAGTRAPAGTRDEAVARCRLSSASHGRRRQQHVLKPAHTHHIDEYCGTRARRPVAVSPDSGGASASTGSGPARRSTAVRRPPARQTRSRRRLAAAVLHELPVRAHRQSPPTAADGPGSWTAGPRTENRQPHHNRVTF